MKLFSSQRGIIIAADVSDLDRLKNLVEISIGVPEVVGIKIGFILGLKFSLPAVVWQIRKINPEIPIIYDHQKAGTDIPAMGKPFAKLCKESGINGIIFFPQAGPKTCESFVKATFDENLTPIIGLVMTHEMYLTFEGGFIADNAPDRLCEIALDLGVRNFVLPGTKLDITKKYSLGKLAKYAPVNIMMPGIGKQGGSIISAFKATANQNHYAIIGSAIYKSNKPKESLINFVKEMKNENLN
jgi:orotidine-5'-phosphate decarboxylase